jgi:hypothetical protein
VDEIHGRDETQSPSFEKKHKENGSLKNGRALRTEEVRA